MHSLQNRLGELRGLRNRGQTLIELMVAGMLAVAVASAAIAFYGNERRRFVATADAVSMRDAGTAALQLIGAQIEMAGYTFADVAASGSVKRRPAVLGCSSAMPIAIDDGFACIPGVNGSDGIAIRFVDDAVFTWPSAAGQATDCLGQGVGAPGERAVVVNRFFVDKPARRKSPEMYCVGNGAPRNKQPVVGGIERLRLRYWLRGASEFVDASSIASDRWGDVVAVQVCVLARGAMSTRYVQVPAYMQYRDCDGHLIKSVDGLLRQAFSRRFVVRNQVAAT